MNLVNREKILAAFTQWLKSTTWQLDDAEYHAALRVLHAWISGQLETLAKEKPMGSALRFNEEARACAVAYYLAALGYGVLWDADKPKVVMCSADRKKVRELLKDYSNVDEEWFKRPKVDVGARAQEG